MCVIDIFRICFNAHETMAPSRGWQRHRNSFAVIYLILNLDCPCLLKQIWEVSINV